MEGPTDAQAADGPSYLVELCKIMRPSHTFNLQAISLKCSRKIYPQQTLKKIDSGSELLVQTQLEEKFPNKKIQQIHSLLLDPKNTIRKDTFVQVISFL